jgi:hypothetical protein
MQDRHIVLVNRDPEVMVRCVAVTVERIPMSAPLIEAYLRAADTLSADEILVHLLEQLVEPQVTSLIRQKLHVTLQPTDDRRENQDALELVGEVKTLIVSKLARLKEEQSQSGIENFNGYVQAVIINTANHYLRRKYPVRLRLKNQLRYVLSHDKRFAIWSDLDGHWVCGLADWQNGDIECMPLGVAQKEALRKTDPSPEVANLSELLVTIFFLNNVPMLFGDLVSTVYAARRAREPVEVAEEDCHDLSLDEHRSTHNKLENVAVLKALWSAIKEMPQRHRRALLLNLRASDGESLITFFPITRTASIREIAACLEMKDTDLAAIWNDLPWDDSSIAEYMGLTRQQVINLRHSARSMLKRRLKHL